MLLMDRFSESGAAYTLLKAYSGKRGVYIKPDAATEQTVKDLVQALVDYEKNPSKITINKVIALLDNLDMTAHKVTSFNETRLSYATDKDLEISDKDDILFFHAKDKDKIKGIGQLSFFWRFGDVVIPGQANTYKNPVKPIILSSLHEGTDGAGFMALSEFSKLKAKVLVINGLHKSSSKLPSPFQIERTITDAPHSPNVLPIPFLEQALRVNFPDFALVVVHGLGRNNPDGTVRQMKLWFINSAPGQFDLTQKSWPALLAIAFAQRDFNFGEVSIKCKFPNSFIVDDKGKKRNITSNTAKYDGSSLFAYIGGPTSDVQMHIVNNETALRSSGKDSGRGVHIEHRQQYQADGPTPTDEQKHLLDAFVLASEWFIKWDPVVHKFAEMPKDFRQFPKWFNDKLKNQPVQNNAKALLFSKVSTIQVAQKGSGNVKKLSLNK